MHTLGIDFRIRPVVLETLLPFSRGAASPSGGSPVVRTTNPPTPHLINSLLLIPDIRSPSTQRDGQSANDHDATHGKDPDHDKNRGDHIDRNPAVCKWKKEKERRKDPP